RAWTVEAGPLDTLLASGAWQLRLPTEAEWEKAAGWEPVTRRKRLYAWGNTWDTTKANVDGQVGRPSAVGVFPAGASAYGVLDMTGNVWEWTLSQYVGYRQEVRHDPEGETRRALRGGAWDGDARGARVSYRLGAHPDVFDGVGVRVVVAPAL